MILILTGPEDAHADHVIARLGDLGASFIRFDPSLFPQSAAISVSYSPSGLEEQVLIMANERIAMAEVQSIWYRRPGSPVPHDDTGDAAAREYVALECAMVIHDLWSSLDGSWLPGRPAAVRRAEHKGLQLKLAGELGFELPPTLITSCPVDMLEFYRQHDGLIVSKQAATAFPATIGLGMVRFTELVTTRDLSHCNTISRCPTTFQAYVPKSVELRITVVGRRVFAAEIHSQATNHTRFDWRRYDLEWTPHLPHALPREVEQRCVALVDALDLQYGAIDMIVTPDGRYVFIEINPTGQYLWIEQEAGLPITDAICELLIGGATAGREECGVYA
jgi:hypothetical protein